jgi:FtsH-binding integral membrane protein
MGTLMWINNSSDSEKTSDKMRMGQLAVFGFFQGASIGPLVNAVMYVDPAVVVTALVGTATVFACFTAASLSAARRSYLYLGGVLSSALSLLFWLSFANWFFRFQWVHTVQLYGGLLMFIGYVIFDTQFILEVRSLYVP